MSSFPMTCNPYHARLVGEARMKKDSEASRAPTTTTPMFIPQPIFQRSKSNLTLSIANVSEAMKNMIKLNIDEVVHTPIGN